MTVTDSAFIAVLENKLVQAERNLYEFRRIFNHFVGNNLRSSNNPRSTEYGINENGLYPGQLPPLPLDDDEENITEPEQCNE
jgi:hypothetical protein